MLTDDQKKKAEFVRDYVKPLLMASVARITDVEYKVAGYEQTVEITHNGGYVATVYVNMDSNAAIVKDICRQYLDRY